MIGSLFVLKNFLKKESDKKKVELYSFLSEETRDQLKQIPEDSWTRNSLEDLIKNLIETHDLGTGDTLWPMRVALTGREKSPGPFEVAEVLGKEESLKRLKIASQKI